MNTKEKKKIRRKSCEKNESGIPALIAKQQNDIAVLKLSKSTLN